MLLYMPLTPQYSEGNIVLFALQCVFHSCSSYSFHQDVSIKHVIILLSYVAYFHRLNIPALYEVV